MSPVAKPIPFPIEVFLTWLTFAASGLLGVVPFGILAALGILLLPSEIIDTPIRDPSMGDWLLPFIVVGIFLLGLIGAGIYATTNLWILFAEPRFSERAIGFVIGGERHIPRMHERASRLAQRARRLTRR